MTTSMFQAYLIAFAIGLVASELLLRRFWVREELRAISLNFPKSVFGGESMSRQFAWITLVLYFDKRIRTTPYETLLLCVAWIGHAVSIGTVLYMACLWILFAFSH